jgi:type IX secretion system PorP/SprF family membrane protein
MVNSQDYHFSGFMQNMVYVNPGYSALPSSAEAGLTYRNQWPGIPATFVTYGAALVVPVKALNSGIGVTIMNDVQGSGVISRASATFTYGYLIELDRNWQIGTGLSASWVMKQFSADELIFRSDLLNDLGYSYGNVTFDNYSRNYPDFSVGIIARRTDFFSFGVSASHLTRPRDTDNTLTDSRLPMKYTAFASMILGAANRYNSFTIEPAVFYSHQEGNREIIWGTMFNLQSKFLLGSWLRHNTNFNFDALILTAGISWEKYNISYSYDVNLKKLSFLSTKMAAHEVTFLYRFEYKDEHKVKKFRKSECPAY